MCGSSPVVVVIVVIAVVVIIDIQVLMCVS